jgi:hypothetical protein
VRPWAEPKFSVLQISASQTGRVKQRRIGPLWHQGNPTGRGFQGAHLLYSRRLCDDEL